MRQMTVGKAGLATGLLFWLCIPCLAHGAAENSKQKAVRNSVDDVQVVMDLGNVAGGDDDEPLKALSNAITKNVKARFFRVTWQCDVFSLYSTITALYDRHRKTIGYYCTGGHSFGGNPAEIVYAHYLYVGVTDGDIRRASKFLRTTAPYPNAVEKSPIYTKSGTPGSYYDALLTFGGHRKKLP